MKDVVIVDSVRTGLAKSYRGSFNLTRSDDMVAHVIDALEIDNEIYNVNGGSIAIGHPFGMTGSRMTGSLLRELRRRGKKYGVVTMCIGGVQGASALFEALN